MNFNELNDKYTSSSHHLSIQEVDNFKTGKTKRYATVLEKTGDKTASGRDIYKDEKLWFREQANGKFKPAPDPFKKK